MERNVTLPIQTSRLERIMNALNISPESEINVVYKHPGKDKVITDIGYSTTDLITAVSLNPSVQDWSMHQDHTGIWTVKIERFDGLIAMQHEKLLIDALYRIIMYLNS